MSQSYLTDFDVLLSGYSPSAETVSAIGVLARDLTYRSATRPGGFFWILDPVMGDQGRLYVHESVPNAYKNVLHDADLILPNQFEAETLSGVKITDMASLSAAATKLHREFSLPHIIVTSVRLGENAETKPLTLVGSSAKSDHTPRLFKIAVPQLPCFFSGTGDMFAGLMVVRLREACGDAGLLNVKSWMSPDDVQAEDLPLARATEKVLSSMQMVLEKTLKARDEAVARWGEQGGPGSSIGGVDASMNSNDESKRKYLYETKAAEVKIVRNARDLLEPEQRYRAERLEV